MIVPNSSSRNKSSTGTVLSNAADFSMTDPDGASRKRNHSPPTSVPRKGALVQQQPQQPKQQPPQQQPDHSKRRKVDTSVSSASSTISDDPEFVALDPTNPVHARRMQQRRRMVSYGKNTVGYDKYIQQVPKDERRLRSMKTPSTPDHTLDIPNKRWSGMIRAWRRALHQYDPSDLQNNLGEESSHGSVAGGVSKTTSTGEAGSSPVLPMTVHDREIAQAHAQGLLVDTSMMDPGAAPMVSPTSLAPNRNHDDDKNSHVENVIFNGTSGTSATREELELDEWDVTRQKNGDENWWADEDSDDDDLL